jgi:hypothetical protein
MLLEDLLGNYPSKLAGGKDLSFFNPENKVSHAMTLQGHSTMRRHHRLVENAQQVGYEENQ